MSWSTLTSSQRAWRVLLSLAIVAGVPALAASHVFYVSAIASTFYPYVFASAGLPFSLAVGCLLTVPANS